jgi:hypothetical protein
MNNDITDIIRELRKQDFYGAGESVEIAKGKHEIVSSWIGFKRKVKRIIKAK